MEIIPTYFICIIWLTAITKSIYIGCRSLNDILLLQKCQKARKLRYHILISFFINSNLVIIIVLTIVAEIKSLDFKLSSWFMP